MNKRKKIFIIFIIIIEIFIVNSNYSYADRAYKMEQDEKATSNPSSQESQQSSLGDVFSQADTFIIKGKVETQNNGGVDENKLKDVFSNIFNVGIGIGMALTVIIGGILGIKFMIASAEDKAKIKEMMIPYVIGCIVIFGAFAIWKFMVNILNNIG